MVPYIARNQLILVPYGTIRRNVPYGAMWRPQATYAKYHYALLWHHTAANARSHARLVSPLSTFDCAHLLTLAFASTAGADAHLGLHL